MRHPEFPVVSFLCILLLLCSLPSHIKARSVSTIALIAWLGVMSLIRGINTIIWANNFVVRLEVWCDITTKITIGFTYAVPASALCILRHLESVASSRTVRATRSDKRRRQKFEALMCIGIPALGMALHYIVQGHRFDLFEDLGCAPTVYFSVASIIIIWVPPMIMSLTTFGYAALAIRHFLRHRIEFATYLHNSQSALTPTRYFRLMAMAIVEMVWDTGVNAYVIYFNTFEGLRPWISWENVHSNFSRVQLFPEYMIPPEFKVQLIWQWWIIPVSCICFFLFFGFGEEALSDYRVAINWVRRVIFRHKPRAYGKSPVLPLCRSPPQNSQPIDLTFPASKNSSTRDMTVYDEPSLKMPEIFESSYLPPAPLAFLNTTRPVSPLALKTDDLSQSMRSRSSVSTDISEKSISSPSSKTRPLASPAQLDGPAPRKPPFTVTRPGSETFSPDGHNLPFHPLSLAATHSPTATRDWDARRSTSSNISSSASWEEVSDAGTSETYEENNFLSQGANENTPSSRPNPECAHPHHGEEIPARETDITCRI